MDCSDKVVNVERQMFVDDRYQITIDTGNAAASYLDESIGKPQEVLNFMAPLVGVFGMGGASQFANKYGQWGIKPY